MLFVREFVRPLADRLRPGRWLWAAVFVGGALTIAAAPAPGASERQPSAGLAPALTAIASSPNLNLLAPLPAVAPPVRIGQPLRWAYMVGASLPDSLRDHAGQIDIIAPAWFHTDANGTLVGSDSPAVSQFARTHGIKIVPIVSNGAGFQGSVAHALLTDGNRQTNLLDSLQWLVQTYGYAGVNIDFENVPPADRDGFSALMSNIHARLHPLGSLVTAAVPAKTAEKYTGFGGPFNYAALAPNLDLAVIMAYDQHYAGSGPGPVADVAWVNDVVSYAKSQIPASKLLLGIPFYGYDWAGHGGGRAVSYADVVNKVFATGATIHMDEASQTPSFSYGSHQVWFENSDSLKAKLNLVTSNNLAGWGAWRLGQEDPNFWTLTLGR